MRTLKGIAFILTISTLAGCTILTQQQNTEYSMMEKDNVLVKEKTPSTGALLGILPGGGAFYGRQSLLGVVDLLLWPASVLWDPVVGFETSKKINYDLTVAEMDRTKAKELSALEDERDLQKIDNTTYVTRKREIEQKYDYHTKL
jgi:hypothetical protein